MIRVVLFHQLAVTFFDGLERDGLREAQDGQGVKFRVARGGGVEIRTRGFGIGKKPRFMDFALKLGLESAVGIGVPGRAVAIETLDNLAFNVDRLHPGKEIPRGVIFLDMFQAEPMVIL